ncbi:MAG TPA: hypothetical protein VLA04_00685 [Verrucomicrobiae bacterium]|nr:hypothetical protein [Verrucomicrobiae bacterium]
MRAKILEQIPVLPQVTHELNRIVAVKSPFDREEERYYLTAHHRQVGVSFQGIELTTGYLAISVNWADVKVMYDANIANLRPGSASLKEVLEKMDLSGLPKRPGLKRLWEAYKDADQPGLIADLRANHITFYAGLIIWEDALMHFLREQIREMAS